MIQTGNTTNAAVPISTMEIPLSVPNTKMGVVAFHLRSAFPPIQMIQIFQSNFSNFLHAVCMRKIVAAPRVINGRGSR